MRLLQVARRRRKLRGNERRKVHMDMYDCLTLVIYVQLSWLSHADIETPCQGKVPERSSLGHCADMDFRSHPVFSQHEAH